jgi:hypothetical protein
VTIRADPQGVKRLLEDMTQGGATLSSVERTTTSRVGVDEAGPATSAATSPLPILADKQQPAGRCSAELVDGAPTGWTRPRVPARQTRVLSINNSSDILNKSLS